MPLTREDLYFGTDNAPAALAKKINDMVAVNATAITASSAVVAANAVKLAARPKVVVVAGTNAAVIASPADVASVVSILAVTTATGAFAAKSLLALTTDYTVAAGKVTTVGDLSALTLIITYIPA